MINRNLQIQLYRWKESATNLSLILRGARQVGKTTLINEFENHLTNIFSLILRKIMMLFFLGTYLILGVLYSYYLSPEVLN